MRVPAGVARHSRQRQSRDQRKDRSEKQRIAEGFGHVGGRVEDVADKAGEKAPGQAPEHPNNDLHSQPQRQNLGAAPGRSIVGQERNVVDPDACSRHAAKEREQQQRRRRRRQTHTQLRHRQQTGRQRRHARHLPDEILLMTQTQQVQNCTAV
jgi:hypothetical protein